MRVKLPRECSGQEIVNAFKAAATFQENFDNRFEAHEFVNEIGYEPGSVKRVIRSMGAVARFYYRRKRFIFFGKIMWRKSDTLTFNLAPLDPLEKYNEVDIGFEFVYEYLDDGYLSTSDPRSSFFEGVRPKLESILARFYSQLQLESV